MILKLLDHGGGGFDRPATGDLYDIIHQLFNWMQSNTLTWQFAGHVTTLSLWDIFIQIAIMFFLINVLEMLYEKLG